MIQESQYEAGEKRMGGWLCQAAEPFYKHPIEILADSVLAAVMRYLLLGCCLRAATFSRQRESVSIIQILGLHAGWNILSRRRNCIRFTVSSDVHHRYISRCRSLCRAERHFARMLLFKDIHKDQYRARPALDTFLLICTLGFALAQNDRVQSQAEKKEQSACRRHVDRRGCGGDYDRAWTRHRLCTPWHP